MLTSSIVTLTLALSVSTALAAPSRLSVNSTIERRANGRPITNCVNQGEYALTFDDGPYTYGHEIAKLIEQNGGKTTFFVNGYNYGCIYDYADELISRYKAGHQIASHTWNHDDITSLSSSKLKQQITLVETALGKILGIKPRYFRPPYGDVSTSSVKQIQNMGYQVVTWDSDSGDSDGASASQSIATYKKLAKTYPAPHMTLNHETYASTGNTVMPSVVPMLVKAGYKLVTVAQCMGQAPYQSTFAPGKRDSTWTCAGTPPPNPDR